MKTPFKTIIAAILVSVGLGVGGIIVNQQGGESPTGGFTTANLWIDSDGGSCTYVVSVEEYDNDGDECATFDAAYDSARAATGASCGGRVLIRAGTYGSQTLTGYRSNCPTTEAGQTLFAPESFDCDATSYPTSNTPVVVIGSVRPGDAENEGASNSAGHVTICGVTQAVSNVQNTNSSGTVTDNSRYSMFIRGARYWKVKRSIFGGFALFKNHPSAFANSGEISFLYNLIEECHEYSDVCSNGKVDIVDGALFEGNFFRNFRSLANCTSGGAVDCGHWETMFLNGTTDVTIKRNRFFNYEHSGAIYTTCSGPDVSAINSGYCHRNLLIENNWFESPSNTNQGGQNPGDGGERGEAVVGPGHCEGSSTTDLDNVVIRNNTVVGAAGEILLGSGSLVPGQNPCVIGSGGVHITGNIANRITSFDGCSVTNLTIDYNIGTIYSSNGLNPCGANRHNSTLNTSLIVNGTWGSQAQNMHLLSSSTVASGFVPQAICPVDDYDGDLRPTSAPCDAGADEKIESG